MGRWRALVPVAGLLALAACGTPSRAASPAPTPTRTSVGSVPPPTSGTTPALPRWATPVTHAPARRGSGRPGPLAGALVVLDPGHNGGNAAAASVISRLTDRGTAPPRACDTVGTETATRYPEHAFAWDLATRLTARLVAAGARVVLTRSDDAAVGPCVPERAHIANRAALDAPPGTPVVALSLHADGGPPAGVGFHVIEPLPVAGNEAIVEPSRRLGAAVRDAFGRGTGEPRSTYTGTDGITRRNDLGGLNLSRVPKVFVECGNMRNAQDASRLADPAWRERAAAALVQGLRRYLAASA